MQLNKVKTEGNDEKVDFSLFIYMFIAAGDCMIDVVIFILLSILGKPRTGDASDLHVLVILRVTVDDSVFYLDVLWSMKKILRINYLFISAVIVNDTTVFSYSRKEDYSRFVEAIKNLPSRCF